MRRKAQGTGWGWDGDSPRRRALRGTAGSTGRRRSTARGTAHHCCWQFSQQGRSHLCSARRWRLQVHLPCCCHEKKKKRKETETKLAQIGNNTGCGSLFFFHKASCISLARLLNRSFSMDLMTCGIPSEIKVPFPPAPKLFRNKIPAMHSNTNSKKPKQRHHY